MHDGGSGLRFMREAGACGTDSGQMRGQNFDCYRSIQFRIDAAKHHAHATLADDALDLVNSFTLAAWIYAILTVGGVILLYAFIFPATEWSPYLVWLLAWTVATFALYFVDKSMSKLDTLRVPEVVLHGAALAGGFIGGWLGMLLLWHKVRNTAFWVVLTVSTLVLMAGIGGTIFSELPMVSLYGQVIVLLLATALAGDLLILPAIIRVADGWREKRKAGQGALS